MEGHREVWAELCSPERGVEDTDRSDIFPLVSKFSVNGEMSPPAAPPPPALSAPPPPPSVCPPAPPPAEGRSLDGGLAPGKSSPPSPPIESSESESESGRWPPMLSLSEKSSGRPRSDGPGDNAGFRIWSERSAPPPSCAPDDPLTWSSQSLSWPPLPGGNVSPKPCASRRTAPPDSETEHPGGGQCPQAATSLEIGDWRLTSRVRPKMPGRRLRPAAAPAVDPAIRPGLVPDPRRPLGLWRPLAMLMGAHCITIRDDQGHLVRG